MASSGYMSPEYAMNGLFSVKSDVYSFGVLLLEIINGKKNSDYYNDDDPLLILIEKIWNMWKDGKALELADSSMHNSCPVEVLRVIQGGLLCVQESAVDRPTMSSVVLTLGTETTIPPPKQPAFVYHTQQSIEPNSSPIRKDSINQVTISVMEAR